MHKNKMSQKIEFTLYYEAKADIEVEVNLILFETHNLIAEHLFHFSSFSFVSAVNIIRWVVEVFLHWRMSQYSSLITFVSVFVALNF